MSEMDAAPPARPGPEHERLAPFVGRWSTEGEVLAGDSGPAHSFAGVDSYAWLPGGFFLLHGVDVRIGGERVQATEIIGSDAADGAYFMRSFDHQGNADVMRMSEQGGVWTVVGETARFTGAFGDGGTRLSGRWERLDGAQWVPWMDVRLTRTDPQPEPRNETMSESSIPDLVRRYFAASQGADRAAMEALLADDFTFTSPWDDHIDRAEYFARCWPHAGTFRFRDDMKIFAEGDEAFVRYETEGKPGGTFRNTELFRIEGGRIRSIEVFFGFIPAGAPPSVGNG